MNAPHPLFDQAFDAELTGDQIVYSVVTNSGGIDGMDRDDKGGVIKFASYDKAEAESQVDPWSTVKSCIVNVEERRKVALNALTAIEKLLLGIAQPKKNNPKHKKK